MIINERASRHDRVIAAGLQMLTAARTAPKGRGGDIVECCLVEGDDIRRLSEEMLRLHAETGRPVYERDAANILRAEAIVVIATRSQPLGLNCAHCGYATCELKPAFVPCAINSVDVGIAIGSAVSRAADLRLDTRVLFSAGMAAERLALLPDCTQYYCIPLSSTSKNPFFDR